jgi:hypothetical protein
MSKRWQRVLSTLATRVAAQNHTKGKSRCQGDGRQMILVRFEVRFTKRAAAERL